MKATCRNLSAVKHEEKITIRQLGRGYEANRINLLFSLWSIKER